MHAPEQQAPTEQLPSVPTHETQTEPPPPCAGMHCFEQQLLFEVHGWPPFKQQCVSLMQKWVPNSQHAVPQHARSLGQQSLPQGVQLVQVPLTQLCPLGQPHVLPQGDCPLRQVATAPRQVPVDAFAQATPAPQQAPPHGVVPAGQPHWPVVALRHAIPARQQHGPQGVVPAAQGADPTLVGPAHAAAATRLGRSAARVLAATPPNVIPSARRREIRAVASVRVKSSNGSPAIVLTSS
jgi:hypothetical protein